ncbi:leucine-rich repeat domain-containing protein [Chaetoceros tenuissimus]|uniref:Leucine-rich repeat domain-containing protein n=1 Tax=Chaetoceros tenuissimus TaxID=426638 RepID=A0AAD3CPW5_9STRA|nr:leucine-rich repeat domain-containing protein [Chaetoceros tenuissimus]
MADSVITIESGAFMHCKSLVYVKLSRNLQYIVRDTFFNCISLVSLFIPSSCRGIGYAAFERCPKLIMLSVPQHTVLEEDVIVGTALIEKSPFEKLPNGTYPVYDDINGWIKSINNGRNCTLHRICCSTYENEALPISEAIYEVVREQGPQMLQAENKIGITPLQYLAENPYLENIDEMKMLRRYMLEMIRR